ncbi:MAG: hypothetical protein WCO42_10510, partial [bacterium]
DRTADLVLTKDVLYQLSYVGFAIDPSLKINTKRRLPVAFIKSGYRKIRFLPRNLCSTYGLNHPKTDRKNYHKQSLCQHVCNIFSDPVFSGPMITPAALRRVSQSL